MKLYRMIQELAEAGKQDVSFIEVCVDGGVPTPVEDLFEITNGKGRVLLKPKAGVQLIAPKKGEKP